MDTNQINVLFDDNSSKNPVCSSGDITEACLCPLMQQECKGAVCDYPDAKEMLPRDRTCVNALDNQCELRNIPDLIKLFDIYRELLRGFYENKKLRSLQELEDKKSEILSKVDQVIQDYYQIS